MTYKSDIIKFLEVSSYSSFKGVLVLGRAEKNPTELRSEKGESMKILV